MREVPVPSIQVINCLKMDCCSLLDWKTKMMDLYSHCTYSTMSVKLVAATNKVPVPCVSLVHRAKLQLARCHAE